VSTPAQTRTARGDDDRDRLLERVAAAALLIVAAGLCWAVTAVRMQGMDMGPGTPLGGLGWFVVVWATMMAAMMLPSLVPMATAFVGIRREGRRPARALGACLFACGYLLTWAAAGVAAYALFQGAVALHIPWLAWSRGGRYVAGAVIVGAALYELTPAKYTCLRHCREPTLLARRWRPGAPGALLTGIEHGCFCVGSSWALMAALFALGVMNLSWMVLVAVLVTAQKVLPWEAPTLAATAAFVAALGLAVALAPHQVPGLTIPG